MSVSLVKGSQRFRSGVMGGRDGTVMQKMERSEKMARKVVLDQECCIACESCVELCPEVFQMDEASEKAHVILPEGGNEACIEEAIDTCPVGCISWEE